jgi:hypothetical protein
MEKYKISPNFENNVTEGFCIRLNHEIGLLYGDKVHVVRRNRQEWRQQEQERRPVVVLTRFL